jgi:23S rRNA (cytidine1920-2'-O)/16S rRNA (cytidine1409-2'-O)-methyltransferase
VTVDGAPAFKPSTQVQSGQDIVIAAPPKPYVSRGGEKLEAALARFDVDPSGRRCLDAGASTGGFTDCLLQHGATHVVAVDVGYGQIADSLRRDPRVTVLERTNVRDLEPSDIPGPSPDLLTADLSFISLRLVLEPLREVLARPSEGVLLVKPQFEAGRERVRRGGLVHDPEVWRDVVGGVARAAERVGWAPADAMASPLRGPAGNVEFFLHVRDGGAGTARWGERLDMVVREAEKAGADPA